MSDLPKSIGRYQVRRELGRGMMGVVYLAQDPDLGRDIALKVIQVPLGANDDDREGFEERFFAEAQSAARLSHPGIVIVHDVGRDPASGALYMALQLLPGQTLENLLIEKGKLDWPDALRLTRRVAEALQHAHFEGVVHRDIKPANIMIMPTGEPKLMDFGIAKLEAKRLTAAGDLVGTPLYMSPEQALGRPVDGRSDVFSLGSVLYEMLTGIPAFGGETVAKIILQIMSVDPEPPSRLVPSLSLAVDNILRRCLAKEPEARYKDAQALADDISDIIGKGTDPGRARSLPETGSGETTSARPSDFDWAVLETRALDSRPRRDSAPGRRQSLLAISLVAAALGLAGWLVTSLDRPGRPLESGTPAALPLASPIPSPANSPKPTAKPSASPRLDRNARLNIDFEHSLKAGILKVFVDEVVVVDQAFGERALRKPGGLAPRKDGLAGMIEVRPGLRNLRVQVSWDDNVKSERSQTYFNPGSQLALKAKLGGLRKNLSLRWN